MGRWAAWIAHIYDKKEAWRLRCYCPTFEWCKSKKLHAHLMVQFDTAEDNRTSRDFAIDGILPNARPARVDHLGQAPSPQKTHG